MITGNVVAKVLKLNKSLRVMNVFVCVYVGHVWSGQVSNILPVCLDFY